MVNLNLENYFVEENKNYNVFYVSGKKLDAHVSIDFEKRVKNYFNNNPNLFKNESCIDLKDLGDIDLSGDCALLRLQKFFLINNSCLYLITKKNSRVEKKLEDFAGYLFSKVHNLKEINSS